MGLTRNEGAMQDDIPLLLLQCEHLLSSMMNSTLMSVLTPRRNRAAAHLLDAEAIPTTERVPTSLMNDGWAAGVSGSRSGRSGTMAVEDRARGRWAAGSGTRHSAPAAAGSRRDMSTWIKAVRECRDLQYV